MKSWQGVVEFVAVVETSSFTQAAKRLKTSTANVSRQIALLEERLSTRLLFRTTRKVSPTEEGNVYYQHCKQVLEGLKEAENAITQQSGEAYGHIRLTAPVTYGEQIVMPIILDFMQIYPNITIDFDLTNTQLDLVNSNCDFALRLGTLTTSSLICRKLSQRKLLVCGSPTYLEKKGVPHVLSELEAFNCLRGQHDFWRFCENGKERVVRVKGNLRSSSGLVLLDAALRDMGLIQLPDYYVNKAINHGKLVRVLSHYQYMDEGIWALFPHRGLQPHRVKLLLTFLAERLPLATEF